MTPLDQALASARLFDEMIEATRNRDDVAYARAKRAFWNSIPREADVSNKPSAAIR